MSSNPDPVTSPPAGPSDSSDSPSDLPSSSRGRDSDAQGTGSRPAANPRIPDEDPGADIRPDDVVDEAEAGVSHSPPDAVRNGGEADTPEPSSRRRGP
jgi:hypothetical protein